MWRLDAQSPERKFNIFGKLTKREGKPKVTYRRSPSPIKKYNLDDYRAKKIAHKLKNTFDTFENQNYNFD